MDKPARQSLKQRIEDTQGALETSLCNGASTTDLRAHHRSLQMLDQLLERFPAAKVPSWLLPFSIATVAAALLGLAAVVRLPGSLVTIDARISSLTITAASDGTGLNSDAAIAVKSLEIAGDATAQAFADTAISISSLKLAPGTTAVVRQQASCIEFEIPVGQKSARAGMSVGLDVVVLHPSKDQTELPTPVELRAKPGTTVTICGEFAATYALAGSVESIDLYRRQPGDAARGFVNMRTPSILSGKLRVPSVNRASELQDTDMLSFGGVTQGWVFIFPATAMRVVFSGTVEHAVSVSPTPEVGTDALEPTLLEWLTKSPLATAVFGLITGLVGMLWALGKYFGFLAR